MRTTLVTATRGEGGQNEIGPELFEALAVLRTEELLAAHRYDGAEQYFTRAVDFGFSFCIEETLEKWGHQEILGDYVRMIRTIRPQVIVGFVFDGEGGGQHHQTSSRLTAEAFRAAADPTQFPEQIKEGLRPWQAAKFYYTAGLRRSGRWARPGRRAAAVNGPGASKALMFEGGGAVRSACSAAPTTSCPARPAACTSARACRSCCRCPAKRADAGRHPRLPPARHGAARRRRPRREGSVRRRRRQPRVAGRLRRREPAGGADGGARPASPYACGTRGGELGAAGQRRHRARAHRRSRRGARTLRRDLAGMGLAEDARFEIDFRLAQKESQFIDALVAATDLRLEAIANDGIVTPGQAVGVQLIAAARGEVPVDVKRRTLNGFDQPSDKGGVIPANARAHRRALQVRDRRRALRPRSGRAVRPAVPADAVHRDVHALA